MGLRYFLKCTILVSNMFLHLILNVQWPEVEDEGD